MVTLRSLLLATVGKLGHRPALWLGGMTVSYRQLDEMSSRIAAALEGPRVAILAGGSVGSYASVFATARSGRTYVPLNAELPDDRLLKIISASAPTTLVVDRQRIDRARRLLRQMSTPIRVVCPDIDHGRQRWLETAPHRILPPGEPANLPPTDVDEMSDDATPLYLMFTSGTTGEPKGILIPRRNVVGYLSSIRRLFDFGQDDRMSNFFRLSFDLSVHDMFVAWTSGACLYVPGPKDLLDPVGFARRHQLSIWFSVPSLAGLAMLSRKLRPDALRSLRHALFCGEALGWEIADGFRRAAPAARITNLYGPTEATIALTHYTVPTDRADLRRRHPSVPIGQPFPGHEAVIVDREMRPLPAGERGELLLGGPQLAPGYAGSPAQTARSFLELELAGSSCRRWYRTGDLMTLTPDGLVFGGRIDTQVKFRGYRIELAEIEGALRQVARTPFAVVIAWPPGAGPVEQLIAFLMPPHPAARELHAGMRQMLPAHMIPRRFVTIEEPPTSFLNQNQKIDRQKITDSYRARVA